MKSTKRSSPGFFSACAKVLVPGRRLLPFELTTGRGAPVVSADTVRCRVLIQAGRDVPKKSLLRELRLMNSLSGIPKTSMMQASCSCSFSPGKMGKPVYNSAIMQPKLHMSIAIW